MKSDIIYTCCIETPLGLITASATNNALTGLWFVGQKHYPKGHSDWVENESYPVFIKLRAWLADYFAGRWRKPDFSIAPQGTLFQTRLWKMLLDIPVGQTRTYGDLAGQMAKVMDRKSMSAQAVGNAVGHNPISLLIPCHRVTGSNGSLTGYAGGLDKKAALLSLEKTGNLQSPVN